MKAFLVILSGMFLGALAIASTRSLAPSDSKCLESAVNQVVGRVTPLHVNYDNKTARVVGLTDGSTVENYQLKVFANSDGVEFLSFENEKHLINISTQLMQDGTCKLIDVKRVPNNGGH